MKRRDLILSLFYYYNDSIVGSTRLQKLIFLIEHEEKCLPTDGSFKFVPYRFGPHSKLLKDDMGFLINVGFIEESTDEVRLQDFSNVKIEDIPASKFLSTRIKTENSSSDEDDDGNKEPEEVDNSATSDDLVYRLTDKGNKFFIQNEEKITDKDMEKIKKVIKKQKGNSLMDILRYVYLKYPEYATESEIKKYIV